MPTELKGDTELRKALRGFEADLSTELYKEMDRLFLPIVRKARGFIPAQINLSGWQKGTQKGKWEYRAWNRNEAIAGIGYSVKPSKPNRKGFVSLARIVNASAAAAIYETAGRKNPDGAKHNQMVNAYFGQGETKGSRPPGYYRVRDDDKTKSSSNNPFAGGQFIDAINEQGLIVDASNRTGPGRRGRKMKGRAIFRAWKEDGGKTQGAIGKAIEASKKEFYAQLGRR